MKKLMSLILALMLCCSAFGTVLADDFVPSISYKDGPGVVTGTDDEGRATVGVVCDADGNVIDHVYAEDCLVITTIAEALNDSETGIPDENEELLEYVYQEILAGRMELPVEGSEDLAIIQLVDGTFLCSRSSIGTDHEAMMEDEGVLLEMTFDLGVAADVPVTVMCYVDGQWVAVHAVKNNGDGTVTCVFEELCPIAFAVPANSVQPPKTGDNSAIGLWIGLLAASSVALAALVIFRRKIIA